MYQLPLFVLADYKYLPARGLPTDFHSWRVFSWDYRYIGVAWLFTAVPHAAR